MKQSVSAPSHTLRTGAVLVVLTALVFVSNAPATAQRPNIVLILADDLGYTDMACYGSKYYETPNIDRLVLEGAELSRFYVCPVCSPTRAR